MQGESFPVLVFDVGGRHYGLPAADVQELVRAVAILAVPEAPPIVEGLINLRGRIVPVLDMRARFQLPLRPLEHTDHFIVARAGDRVVALRVDRALDLVHFHAGDVEEVQSEVAGVGPVAWVAKLSDELVLIHDVKGLLSPAEKAAIDEAVPSDEKGGTP